MKKTNYQSENYISPEFDVMELECKAIMTVSNGSSETYEDGGDITNLF